MFSTCFILYHYPDTRKDIECNVFLMVFWSLYFLVEIMYRWIYNDFPNFIIPDQRRFVSQTTGNLYIAKVEASDIGNYSCFVSSPTIGKSVFSTPFALVPEIQSKSKCMQLKASTVLSLINNFPNLNRIVRPLEHMSYACTPFPL